MRHPKFLALNGNAIALWDEIKDYCDEHHTDGLVTHEAFRTFRFHGKKSMALLTTSCGLKPDGTPYAPLLEAHPVGFKMHDYLDHNDCREAVLARMEAAEGRRDADRARKAEWRARKRDKAEMSRGTNHGTGTSPETGQSRSTTETVPETSPQPPFGGPSRVPCPSHIITDDALATKAGDFLGRYVAVYAKTRHGAHHQLKPARDFPVALELVSVWPDVDYLCGMAELFLLKDQWKPKNEPGTVGQFRHMAPQCDAELRRAGWAPPASRALS